jgi:hypothetical protein
VKIESPQEGAEKTLVVIPSKARDLLFRGTKKKADSSGKPRPSE